MSQTIKQEMQRIARCGRIKRHLDKDRDILTDLNNKKTLEENELSRRQGKLEAVNNKFNRVVRLLENAIGPISRNPAAIATSAAAALSTANLQHRAREAVLLGQIKTQDFKLETTKQNIINAKAKIRQGVRESGQFRCH